MKKKFVDFWDLLTDNQKEELELAWEESEKEENLICHETIRVELKNWLQNSTANKQ